MTIQSVPLSSLEPSRSNPRGRFDAASIEGLAASIRTDGLLQNHWRPDRAFLERRNREQLLAIAEECGCAERYGIGMLRSFKKSDLVGCLLRHFEQARTTDEEAEVWQKAQHWLPEAMQFPAIDPDAPENADLSPEGFEPQGDEPAFDELDEDMPNDGHTVEEAA